VEAGCDTLLVLGDAAAAVAEVFLHRGRLRVLCGDAAQDALRAEAGGRDPRARRARPRRGGHRRRRGRRAAPAGRGRARPAARAALRWRAPAPSLSDSFARYLARDGAEGGRFAPTGRGWPSLAAAALANDHLARLWQAAQPEEAAPHV
jgi:hypothetical protein